MSGTFTLPDGRKLEAHSEPIEVTSMGGGPDPTWTYVDAQGHEHRYEDGKLPTLRLVVDETYLVDDGDGYLDEMTDEHYECTQCGEHIEPATLGASPFAEHVAGPVTYLLDGQPITKDQAQALMAKG